MLAIVLVRERSCERTRRVSSRNEIDFSNFS